MGDYVIDRNIEQYEIDEMRKEEHEMDIEQYPKTDHIEFKMYKKRKNKWESLYIKKKYKNSKKNDQLNLWRKGKKMRKKDKKELNYKRWGKMRKHQNDTKKRFNLQYHLKM